MCNVFSKTVISFHLFTINIISYHLFTIKFLNLLCLLFFGENFEYGEAHKVTAKLISNHNYPVEEHSLCTPDDYILTIYRIPDSPKLKNQCYGTRKQVVFLQHGILCASDDWLINGTETSLAYMFADAGYDVCWHEIGVYDLPAILDYALSETNVSSLHFIAHSQGATAYLVLMSTLPWYNEKVKSVHQFLLSKLGGIFLGYPSFLSWILGDMEFLPITRIQKLLCEYVCSIDAYFKFTLLAYVCETHPAGASTTQIIHYLQLYTSGDFRQYDHGAEINKILYQQETPPQYEISNIKSCVNMYYSNNDYMSAVVDVEYLASLLPCAELYRVPYKDWNHYDFLWSITVKEVINDRIADKVNKYEQYYL